MQEKKHKKKINDGRHVSCLKELSYLRMQSFKIQNQVKNLEKKKGFFVNNLHFVFLCHSIEPKVELVSFWFNLVELRRCSTLRRQLAVKIIIIENYTYSSIGTRIFLLLIFVASTLESLRFPRSSSQYKTSSHN